MNDYMNNVYGAIGSQVSGNANGVPFLGTITDTRIKFGGGIQVVVADAADTYVIDATTLMNGVDATYDNLHVYFEG
jgi:F420-0:gamma-glutamyl ligase-like protein|tara:strand:- start:803 stop:1030 length:228 start_codon:yes stop_codon:yes gene_type:complete